MNASPAVAVFFIDFEAFQHGKDEDFIIKELAIIDSNNPLRSACYVFLPHCSWESLSAEHRRTYNYLERRLHRLTWNEGTLRYCTRCLQNDIAYFFTGSSVDKAIFYTMGEQKAEFLRREFPHMHIEDYGNAFVSNINRKNENLTIKKLPRAPQHISCTYRNHSREHCALLKCYRMYMHYYFYSVVCE